MKHARNYKDSPESDVQVRVRAAKHAHANVYKNTAMSDAQVRAHATKHRRKAKGKRVAIVLGAVVLALVAAAGAYYLWFTLSLNNSLERNTDQEALEALSAASLDKPFYMLVMASDERRDEHNPDKSQYTDVMMLVRVDMAEKKITMLSVPRDTGYTLEDGSVVKFNELYNIGGVKKCIEGVSELTGLPISHYAMVYMSDLKEIVNSLGGVEVNVEYEINNNDPETEENVNVKPGKQTLDGREAQAFAISRHEAPGNEDAYRQGKIRQLITAIVDKVLDRPVVELPGLVVDLAQYVETDLRATDFINLAIAFATNSQGLTVYQASGPSEGDIDEATGMWLCFKNPEGWAKVVEVTDSGGDPSTVTYE